MISLSLTTSLCLSRVAIDLFSGRQSDEPGRSGEASVCGLCHSDYILSVNITLVPRIQHT